MRYIALLLTLIPASAFAGSISRDCQTSDKSIVMGAGNSTNRIQIKFVDKEGKRGQIDAPIRLMPQFDYNTEENDDTLTAIPVSQEKETSRDHKVAHVFHKDGTNCFGREEWSDMSVQSYVITGKNGDTIPNIFEKKVKGQISDGYVTAQFACHSYGVSSAGGCFADEGDKVVWEKQK